MKKSLIILNLIVYILIISCSKEHEEKTYFDSGNLKLLKSFDNNNNQLITEQEYYDLPNDKKFKVLYKKKNYDSLAYFYNNGKLFKNGKRDLKGNLIGKWDYYTRDGFLSNTKEFFYVNNEFCKGCSVFNQGWWYNKAGDTMYYGNNKFNIYKQKEFESESQGEKTSRFFRFDFIPKGDTLSIAEPIRVLAEDGAPVWAKGESYVVLAKEKFNYNNDFSNEKKVKADTFWCLEKDKLNRKNFPTADFKRTVAFGRWFDTPGKKILRGYIGEFYKRKPTPNDSAVKYERRVFFEKIIYVKDTIGKNKNGH